MSAKCHKRTLQPSPHQASGAVLVLQAVAAQIERPPTLVEMTSLGEGRADLAQTQAFAGIGALRTPSEKI